MPKLSPLEELHETHGAVFAEIDGWSVPLRFGPPRAEYDAVRFSAGLIDLCRRAVLSLSGPDASSFLQGMISNDVRKLAAGRGLYAAFLNVQGKVLADVRVLFTGELFVLDLWEPLKEKITAHLSRYLVADEVEIGDLTADYGLLSLQGAQARRLAQRLLGGDPPSAAGEHRLISAAGADARIVRWSWTGEEGYDFIVPRSGLAAFASKLQEPAESLSPVWVGEDALELLRIEAGIPRYGIDFGEDHLLLETGMEHAVDYHKGCYLGQEVVERIRSRGHVNRKLLGLLLEGGEKPEPGDPVLCGDKQIGVVTSAALSPALSRPVALAYLQRDFWQPGLTAAVARGGRMIPGTVSALPFLQRAP